MIKTTTKNGLIAYECTAVETVLLGGCGICDDCGNYAPTGYLVPVLNHYQCPECFAEFNLRAKRYPEDAHIEARTAAYFEDLIPLEEDFSHENFCH